MLAWLFKSEAPELREIVLRTDYLCVAIANGDLPYDFPQKVYATPEKGFWIVNWRQEQYKILDGGIKASYLAR